MRTDDNICSHVVFSVCARVCVCFLTSVRSDHRVGIILIRIGHGGSVCSRDMCVLRERVWLYVCSRCRARILYSLRGGRGFGRLKPARLLNPTQGQRRRGGQQRGNKKEGKREIQIGVGRVRSVP